MVMVSPQYGMHDDDIPGGSPLCPNVHDITAAVMGTDDRKSFVVFDIETGPADKQTLELLIPPFVCDPHPGVFDPKSVKLGNLKDQEKIRQKIADLQLAHEARVINYESDVKKAKDEHWQRFVEKAALDATTGRVVAIGTTNMLGSTVIIDCTMESVGLMEFWRWVENAIEYSIPMVGFNTYYFDLPFLVRRSWINGVRVPLGVRNGRYWNPLFIDLLEAWQMGSRELVKLDTLAKAFGVKGKVKCVGGVDVSGATFHQLWEQNRPVAEAYLAADLRIPSELAIRMGVV